PSKKASGTPIVSDAKTDATEMTSVVHSASRSAGLAANSRMTEAILETPRDDRCVRVHHRPQQKRNHRQRDEQVLSTETALHAGTSGKGPFSGETETFSSSRASPDCDSTSTLTPSASCTRETT